MKETPVTLDTLKELGAIWERAPHAPVHAEYTTGLHAASYCNMTKLIEHPWILARAVAQLLEKAPLPEGPLRFVGSAMGSIAIAHECARIHGGRTAYTEKSDGDMKLLRFSLEPGEMVVLVEDVITTGSTTLKTMRACLAAGVHVAPFVLSIVNRSEKNTLTAPDGTILQIISIIEIQGREYTPEDCPMCKAGSVAKRPKANWAEFAASQA